MSSRRLVQKVEKKVISLRIENFNFLPVEARKQLEGLVLDSLDVEPDRVVLPNRVKVDVE